MKRYSSVLMLFTIPIWAYSQCADNYISMVLADEIRKFVSIEDSIYQAKGKLNVKNVINVDFFRDEKTEACMIKLTSSICYHNCCLMGTYIINNKLIAIYDWRSYCSITFINKDKFLKKIPEKYKSFEDLNLPPHKDLEMRFKIINPQTLKLVDQNFK